MNRKKNPKFLFDFFHSDYSHFGACGKPRKGMTYRLEKLLEKAETDASILFKDVLTHKARADKIRNALAVLQRFKLLFYLPGRVNGARNDPQADNFSQLVADIDKVRSLFKETKGKFSISSFNGSDHTSVINYDSCLPFSTTKKPFENQFKLKSFKK